MMQIKSTTYYLDGTELVSHSGFWTLNTEVKWCLTSLALNGHIDALPGASFYDSMLTCVHKCVCACVCECLLKQKYIFIL